MIMMLSKLESEILVQKVTVPYKKHHRYDFKGVKFGSSEGFLGGVHCAARASGQTWRVRLSIAHRRRFFQQLPLSA